MSAREDILARVHHNRPAGDHALPPIPHFDIPGAEQARLDTFSRALQAMGGRFCRSSEISSPLAWIREHVPHAKIICSAVPEVPSDRPWSAVRKPRDLADVDVAVVRAVLGVAESGSVLFTEAELKSTRLPIWRSTWSFYWTSAPLCPVFKKPTRTRYFGRPATRYFIRGRRLLQISKAY